jgi:hypothetical protein
MALSKTTALLDSLILQVESDLGVPHMNVSDLKSGGKKQEEQKGKGGNKDGGKEGANKKDSAKQSGDVKENAPKKGNEKAAAAPVSLQNAILRESGCSRHTTLRMLAHRMGSQRDILTPALC